MREGEQYANLSCKLDILVQIKHQFNEDIDFMLNNIKQKNSLHDENEE